jgi:DNA (cytosine-5)-methyltransferase 1
MLSKYKILNLYACLGGNRYKWNDVAKEAGIEIEVTAVEWDEELARLYQERFPNDKVIVADAHQYLLDYYKEFDFIWSSPPCPTHSRARAYNPKYKTLYPDMKLYEEIIMLTNVSSRECNPILRAIDTSKEARQTFILD